MSNFIAENRTSLQNRHYIRKAQTANRWFDVYQKKLSKYQEKFGDDFCIVVYGSEDFDDSYVLPFHDIKEAFSEDSMNRKNRWLATITNNVLRVVPPGINYSVDGYYNEYNHLFKTEKTYTNNSINIRDLGLDSTLAQQLKTLIKKFNEQYASVTPVAKLVISETISRPNAITDHLKSLHNYKCQLCNEPGFEQSSSSLYAEVHHIIQLHNQISGTLCSDNLVVVCANCHRKLHYANVKYIVKSSSEILVTINKDNYTFKRNILS